MSHKFIKTSKYASLQLQSTEPTDDKNKLSQRQTSMYSPIYKSLSNIYNIKLLPSAKIIIGNEPVCVWLKFDSSESLILRKTAIRLNLASKISAFNKREYVDLKIPNDSKSISDKFYIVDYPIKQPNCGFVYFLNDNFFHNIILANREFNEPSDIDIILNGSLSYNCLVTGQRMHSQQTFSAKNTIFGWVVAGNAYVSTRIDKATGIKFCYLVKLNKK